MENENKNKSLKVVITGAILLIIAIAAIIFLNSLKSINDLKGIDTNKFSAVYSRKDKPILYIKNGALFSKQSDGRGEATDLSGALCANDVIESPSAYKDIVVQSKSGEVTYFIKDYSASDFNGNLYATTDYKTSFKVDENIFVEPEYEYIKLSNDGKTALYMKNLVVGDSELYADLAYSQIKDGKISQATIAGEIYCSKTSNNIQTDYILSPNGNYIACFSEYNPETKAGGLILAQTGGNVKPLFIENVSSISPLSISDDGTLIFAQTKKDVQANAVIQSVCTINFSDMIVHEFGKAVNKNSVYVGENSDKFVYIDIADEKIHAYEVSCSTGEQTLISDRYFGFTSLDVKNECYIFACSDDIHSSEASQQVFIKTPELSEPALLCDNIALPKHVKASIDYKKIFYLTNYNSSEKSGELYGVEVKDGKLSAPKKIADNVYSFTLSQGGKVLLFETDMNTQEKTVTIKTYKSDKVKTIKENAKLDNISLTVDANGLVCASDITEMFDAKLSYINLSGSNKETTIDDKASFVLYYYDNYLNSTSGSQLHLRNKYYTRGENSILFYKNTDINCRFADLYLFNGKENILVDNEVVTVLFE